MDERVLYVCPERRQEFLGIILEANFSKTPPYTLLLEGEEQISAFPDELKKAPEVVEIKSEGEEQGSDTPNHQPDRNREGAGNDPPSDPSDNDDSGNSSGGSSGSQRRRTSKSSKKKKSTKKKKQPEKSRVPPLKHLPNPCTASAETLAAKRQIKESILK